MIRILRNVFNMKSSKPIFMIAMLLMTQLAMAQTRISGKVTDETGQEIIGTTIYIKNTTIGTISDFDGKYSFILPDSLNNPVLIFSFIGYTTVEELIGGRSVIDAQLQTDMNELDEIIVVGYSTQSKGDVTGALNNVKGKDLNSLPVAGIDQALQGRAPGVNIAANTGAPGEGVSVRIRGVGSLNSSNDPLYIVDGVPTKEVLNILSPQDIAEITILKDASAAAIYGSRANNGVILITTKNGAKNKSTIAINTQVGMQVHGNLTKMTNTNQYVELYNEAADNDNAFFADDLFKRDLIPLDYAATLPNVDQLGAIFRKAKMQNYGITASGGGDKTQYLLSMNYYDQEGIIIGSKYDRLSGRLNVKSDIKPWLVAGANLNISRANTSLVGSSGDGAGGNGGSVVRYAYFRTPAIPIYNADGSFVDLPDDPNFFGDGYNPVGLAKMFDNQVTTDRYFGKMFGIFKLAENLSLTSNFGFDSENGIQRRIDRNWGTNGRINNPNGLSLTNNDAITWTNNNVLNYSFKLGDSHVFNAILGLEAIKGQGHSTYITDRDFPDQDANLIYLGNGLGTPNIGESRYAYTLLSFFGKIDYSYESRYLLSASIRRDGSSRFSQENRWGNFFAVSGAWNLHNEAFMKDNSIISQMKLRVGYGELGNQEIGYYSYSDLIGPNFNYPTNGAESKGYAVTQLGNTDLKWETSSQINAGLDFELYNGVLFGSLDYFYKVTDNMLVKQPNPPSSGFAAPSWVNNGKVLNEGVELLLGFRQEKGDFGYNVTGNVAFLHNEVLKLAAPITGGSIGSSNTTLTEVGHPIGSFYMFEMEGIFQNELDIATSAYQGSKIHPGDVKYKDVDGNSVIDEGDRTHVGSSIPKFTAGLNLSTTYKNFDLTMFFQGAYGFDIYNVAFHDIEGFYRPFNITKDYYDNRWTGEGTTNEYPRASWSGSNNNVRISTRFLKDGSYTRLKNLQLGYNFPMKVTDKLKLGSLRVYISGLNLLTFTKYPGLDPEMTTSNNATGQGDLARGIDWGTYPVAKSYNFGLNLTF